jgi:cell division protein FtsA
MVGEDETMEVASVGGRRPRVKSRRILSQILQPRAEQVFHMLWDEIDKAGCSNSLHSGIVLTGGGAALDGMAEIAEQIFDLPVRRGAPAGANGLGDQASSPIYATAVGAVMYASRNRAPAPPKSMGVRWVLESVSSMFNNFFIGR